MEYMGNTYFSLKNQVIKAERRILKELGFCVHVKHPHKIIIMYLQILECETNTLLAQQAWNFMNDSFRTDVFVRYPPETIGCACIFLSARQLGICLPTRPPWWELFGANLEDLEEISLTLLSLYMRPKANLDTLQKAVGEIRKELEQKKKESKLDGTGPAGSSTPNLSPTGGTTTATRDESRPGTGSRPSSPSKVSPSSATNQADGKKKKSSSKTEEDSKPSRKERPVARGSRRSRSPVNRRSRSRSESRTRSRSRSRSRSYSISISPDNLSRSGSESSDESPEKQKGAGKSKRRRSPSRGRDEEKRTRPKMYDGEYVRKKSRTEASVNSYKRSKKRERSRSPLSPSRSRSRSRSRSPARGKRHRGKYEHDRETKKRDDRHRDRNGVDYRSRDKGRDHGRHRR